MPQPTEDRPASPPPAQPLRSPAAEEKLIEITIPWHNLYTGRKLILVAALAGLLIAAVAGLLLPNTYTATASFITPRTNNAGMSAASAQLAMLGLSSSLSSTLRTPADMYVGILQSDTIARDIIKRFNLLSVYHAKLMSDAEKELSRDVAFDASAKDDIIRVSVTSKRDPNLARDMANAYLDELHATSGRLALTEAAQRRLFFEQQLNSEKNALEDAEVDLKQTEEQTGIIAPGPQTNIEIQTVAATRAQIAAREVDLTGLLQGSTEQDPAVVRLRSEIADLKGQLSRMENGGQSDLSNIPASKMPALQLEHIRKQREVSYHETLFDILARQYEAARLDESHDAPVLQVVDQAVTPDVKSGPHRKFIMLGGLFAGAFLASLWLLSRAKLFSCYRQMMQALRGQ